MKQVAMLMMLFLLAISSGTAQDDAAVEKTAAEQPDVSVDVVADEAGPASPLEELDWMVGEWVDQARGSTITTNMLVDEEPQVPQALVQGQDRRGSDPGRGPVRRLGSHRRSDPILDIRLRGRVWRRTLDPGRQAVVGEGVVRACRR